MTMNFISELLSATIRMSIPLLLAALGELYSERAGLVNIGINGIMTFGAMIGFIAGYSTGNPYFGILAGALAGILINMVYAFFTISLRADQIVYGMALNILAAALATFIYRIYFGITPNLISGPQMHEIAIPFLSKIPIIGKSLFNQTAVVYFAMIAVFLSFVFFNKTKAGLNFKAVGEFPKAAETLGINVIKQKYMACITCGALCGIAGAFLTTSYINTYSDEIVSGRGFIALSAVIFGRWTPVGVLGATLLFGFADALQLRLQLISPNVSYDLFTMLPYVLTIIALAVFGIKKAGPKANGLPYFREDK